MKVIIFTIMLSFMCYGADVVLSVKIPSAKVAVGAPAFLRLHPNVEENEDETPKYATTKLWVQELLRRYLAREIHRGRKLLERDASVVGYDDGMAENN